MEPTIVSGSRVRVAGAERPRPGEVWAFCADDGRLLVHRVAGRVRGGWLLRGDAASAPDPVVSERALVGIVRDGHRPDGSGFAIRRGRRVRGWLRSARWRLRPAGSRGLRA